MRESCTESSACTRAEGYTARAAQDAENPADQSSDPGALAGSHIAGFMVMNLAGCILAHNASLFEVESLLLLAFLHCFQRLIPGLLIGKGHDHETDCRYSCLCFRFFLLRNFLLVFLSGFWVAHFNIS